MVETINRAGACVCVCARRNRRRRTTQVRSAQVFHVMMSDGRPDPPLKHLFFFFIKVIKNCYLNFRLTAKIGKREGIGKKKLLGSIRKSQSSTHTHLPINNQLVDKLVNNKNKMAARTHTHTHQNYYRQHRKQ